MMNRRLFLGTAFGALVGSAKVLAATRAAPKRGIMLMNRIAPSTSELFIADADGGNERKLLRDSLYEYHASPSVDGKWVVFTSERNGDGQSDLFRARLDGGAVEPLVSGASVDDVGVLSPDGRRIAFTSTRNGYDTNIWVRDLRSGAMRNLTGSPAIRGPEELPHGFFRPAWSPDGKWIAFSSDRNTPWRGHDDGKGWEHTQELSLYLIRPDGTGFRKIASKPGYCLGSPKWSPDGRRVVFYEITTEGTWGARRPEWIGRVESQIVSIDLASGERTDHTNGPGLKVAPQFIGANEIGYLVKGGPNEGLAYASGRPAIHRALRSPCWTAGGRQVIYEKTGFKARPQGKPLYSWDKDQDYRFTDVFPALALDGTLALTEKQQGNSSIVIYNADGSGRRVVFDTAGAGLDPLVVKKGIAGAFQPAWSPDNQWIAFGLGSWFQERTHGKAVLMRVRRDGTGAEALTDGAIHSGFPSYSADGKQIVFRVWGDTEKGLRIINLADRSIRTLTNGYDNLPGWSPDGKRIVFTRKVDVVNFEVFTIRPDGGDLRQLTHHRANDGHAVWTADGRILWSSGRYGFRDEAALYDNTFQQYGQIFVMNADGSGKRMLTDSLWEDSMPQYMPNR